MLQQTQVATVVPYFERFVAAFPDVAALAAAPIERVLAARGAGSATTGARIICTPRRGDRRRNMAAAFRTTLRRSRRCPASAARPRPRSPRSRSARATPILDGNVKRVLARHRGIDGYPGAPKVEALAVARGAGALAAHGGIETYTQALMDLGATVCLRTRPRCDVCPVADDCVARREHRIAALPAPRPREASCRSARCACC